MWFLYLCKYNLNSHAPFYTRQHSQEKYLTNQKSNLKKKLDKGWRIEPKTELHDSYYWRFQDLEIFIIIIFTT